MGITLWILIIALATNGIGLAIGLFVFLWLWRNAHSNRWQRLSIVAATTAFAFGGLVNSLFALVRLRSYWFSP